MSDSSSALGTNRRAAFEAWAVSDALATGADDPSFERNPKAPDDYFDRVVPLKWEPWAAAVAGRDGLLRSKDRHGPSAQGTLL